LSWHCFELGTFFAQVLLHHEQFKIPENLARFAVKAGMGGFVKKMGPAVVNFVANRRQRVDPVRLNLPVDLDVKFGEVLQDMT
jgi:hypothetical protein